MAPEKKVEDIVDVTYPEGRNVPVDGPPNRSPYGMPSQGWLTVSNLQPVLSGLYCHVYADLHNSSDVPYEAGSLLFTISGETNYDGGFRPQEGAHSLEKAEHLSTEAVPAKGSVTVLLGTIDMEPGIYDVKVQVQDAKTRQDEAFDPPTLYVTMPGERQHSDDSGNYYPGAGRPDPNSMRVEITQVADQGLAQDGNHEYGVQIKLTIQAADDQGQPVRQPQYLEAFLRGRSNKGQQAEEHHWLDPAVPEGAWEAYHQMDLLLGIDSEWEISVDIGYDSQSVYYHRVTALLGVEGDVLGITSHT